MKPVDPADPPTLRYPDKKNADTLGGDDNPDTLIPTGVIDHVRELVVDDATKVSGTYAMGELLGKGGMGEVLLAHDRRIGRDVALKRMRRGSPTEDEAARFLREARIQARLEHPAIVPVYELSRDAAGRPYFTMKRLSGVTLNEMFANQTAPRQRLLRAFVDVCRAVDYAHTKGVVHRDLKPANITLGEFGEVYVLDWGVARVVEDGTGQSGRLVMADIDTLEGAAPAGDTFGTPGYMAPEQLKDPEVSRGADVYSLGSMMFEVLAGEPLHPRGQSAAIASTLDGAVVLSPAQRRPDRAVPPELDALVVAMLSRNPQQRPTARLCADRIEQYLDGDRDIARRKSMAIDLVWAARTALEHDQRGEAMRTASRALALDPEAEGAAELITTLMLQPPATPPPELAEAIRRSDYAGVSRHAKSAIPGYLAIAAFFPLMIYSGVLRWLPIIGLVGFALLLAFCAWQLVRKPERTFWEMVLYACANAAMLIMLGRLAGPFTFVPALTVYITFTVMTYPAFLRYPAPLAIIMATGFLLPIILEVTDVLPRTWDMVEGIGLISHSSAIAVDNSSSAVIVVAASLVTILMAARQSAVLARANRNNQHALVAQAWHLAQLLPRVAPRAKTTA
jgi:serine/threonine-protein kinase